MPTETTGKLARRVEEAADAALAERGVASPIEVLEAIGWLAPRAANRWRQGRVESLCDLATVEPEKLDAYLVALGDWASDHGLEPLEVAYVARRRDRRQLRFSREGGAQAERAWRTHWVSAQLSAKERQRILERESKAPELVVISALKEWSCAECSASDENLLLMEDDAPLCLACAEMDHLVFLPSGEATLTRRARKASKLAAVVVRFSRSRGRYERQGVLVEEAALERAEREYLADEESRERRRLRDRERRGRADEHFERSVAAEIGLLYPGCPAKRAHEIARHACARGSGRVGRSAAARALEPEALSLAVIAAVRHGDTDYDELLMSGLGRTEAREMVRDEVERVLADWQRPEADLS